jgi:hypothetical protein
VAATNEPAEVTQRAVKATTTAGTMEAMAGETATAIFPKQLKVKRSKSTRHGLLPYLFACEFCSCSSCSGDRRSLLSAEHADNVLELK